ncbi:hypothetical protein [Nitrobacter sp. TKz-YC01]|uniref:hypothetical protein n=1 Tax=Nitrobacter sp. TKz-YC01 TaxID=3398703 RepID=UPI003A101A7C
MAVPEFPASLMRERSGSWQILSSTASVGQSAQGAFPRVTTSGGGLWKCEYGSINLRTPDHVRAWRALEVLCDGGSAPIIVPMCDKRHFPAPIVDGKPLYAIGAVPHSDGALFDDGAGYAQNIVDASVLLDAPLRAVSLALSFAAGGPLRGGEFFSIEHPTQGWHLYEVGTVDDQGGGNSVITFRPPLREAVTAGMYLEFDRPRCVMMLADPNVMKLTLSMRRFADTDVSFVEYFYPV